MAPPSLRFSTRFLIPLVLAAGLLGPVSAASGSVDRDDSDAAIFQHTAVSVTNAVRVRMGRHRLRGDRCLQRFADRQAVRLRDAGELSHQQLGPVMRQCDLSSAGENVALGFPSGSSVVTDGWMKSPSHRANLLYGRYNVLAVGAARDSAGTWYVSQVLGRRGR